MRCFMRELSTMKVRTHVTRLREINDLLAKFPPYVDNQKLEEDELCDCIKSGLPIAWQKQSTLTGFDPSDDNASLDTLIERAE